MSQNISLLACARCWQRVVLCKGYSSISSFLNTASFAQTKMCRVCQYIFTAMQHKMWQNMSAMKRLDWGGSDWGLNCMLWETQYSPVFISWFSPSFLRPLDWPPRNFKNIIFQRLKLAIATEKLAMVSSLAKLNLASVTVTWNLYSLTS